MERQPRFAVGTQYRTRGRHPRLCTITDVLRTYNGRGELVALRYVSEHEFCGQLVVEKDVVETTVAMGLI